MQTTSQAGLTVSSIGAKSFASLPTNFIVSIFATNLLLLKIMNPIEPELEVVFKNLGDEELLAKCSSGSLTEKAQAIAMNEARGRGLNPRGPARPIEPTEPTYYGDFITISNQLTPTEAHLYQGFLANAGIPAEVGDANMVQAYGLLINALGGASLRVPQAFEAEAREVIAAFKRGDFALDDGFEPDAS